MRALIAALVLGTALGAALITTAVTTAAAQARQDSGRSSSLERAFVANGRIRMDLSAGQYRIEGSPDNRIRLDWTVRYPDQLSEVRARADVNGPDAAISIDGPHDSFRVVIQIPARADLHVRMTAGELRVERIAGNKDISLHAGELDIDVGNPDDYRRVEASIWAGELRPGPFGRVKEGLFRSFDWSGNGNYRLEARLKAGELRLHGGASTRR